jgi:hypothetical protein
LMACLVFGRRILHPAFPAPPYLQVAVVMRTSGNWIALTFNVVCM